ncbi:FAD-dependent oxidoreductase [Kitasatospora sp. MAP5-34]|uniref:FAD-dependent oxidoreductase n=1 Tax=Kitasatospora sp. MAP5-34 TaxID=3035102 RepID=UPI002474AEAD|nr:FAD-dependent oxidoreductase [Kitasatospora sp. MAP5-34]MDH6575127.1 thioredoxin reductase [Kitasatospora sp. MAP5-34]
MTVVGAGPYGLSTAAHLKARNVPVRVLGEPMDSWRSRMPDGMFLKSTPFASSISDPAARHRFEDFRADQGQAWVGDRYAVPVAEFIRYGEWFQERCVPEVQRAAVVAIEYGPGGFRLSLDTGEVFTSRAVVLATGLSSYARVPSELGPLVGAGLASHSSDHADLAKFAGQRVAVIGAGQSALESAALLHEAGAEPVVVARTRRLVFGSPPEYDQSSDRALPHRLAEPGSALGPGWQLFAYSRAPAAFRHLPDTQRAYRVRTVLGPAGAWWLRERVGGRFPVLTGHTVWSAEQAGGCVRLRLRGPTEVLEADHVLAATGYRVDVERLDLLDKGLRRALRRTSEGAPRLFESFESSVPGLYLTGLAAVDTFGPVMRFVCGTAFAARRISRAVATGGL